MAGVLAGYDAVHAVFPLSSSGPRCSALWPVWMRMTVKRYISVVVQRPIPMVFTVQKTIETLSLLCGSCRSRFSSSAPCIWQTRVRRSLLYRIMEFSGRWLLDGFRIQRLLVQHWIQLYVSLRRLLEYLTCRVRRRHGQWYVLAGFARHDTPHAVYPSIVGWSVLTCWTVWSRQFRDRWRLHRSSSFMVVDIPFVPQRQISMVQTICSPWSFTSCSSFSGDRCPWYAGRAGSSESFAHCVPRQVCLAYVPQLPLINKVVFTPVVAQSCSPWLGRP